LTSATERLYAKRVREGNNRWRLSAQFLAVVTMTGLLTSGWSSPVWAGDRAAADALFQAGRQAAKQGDYRSACAKFHEADRLDPTVGTTFNLGDCEQHLGRLATAWQYFREVLDKLPPDDSRYKIAQQRASELEKKIPKLTIRYDGEPPQGLKVIRNGSALSAASLGLALPIDPGKAIVVVSALGYKEQRFEIEISQGEQQELVVRVGTKVPDGKDTSKSELPPGDVGTPPDNPTRHKPPSAVENPWKTWGYVSAGAGLVGLGVGVVTGMMVLGKKSTADEHCPISNQCDQLGYDAAQSGSRLAPWTTVGFVVAGVGLGASLFFFLQGSESTTSSTALTLQPGLGHGQLSLRHQW
jgi:tetratricopeptide (TPR) repeat protein